MGVLLMKKAKMLLISALIIALCPKINSLAERIKYTNAQQTLDI